MSLAEFILSNLDPILSDWDDNARSTVSPQNLDRAALRDHAEQILREVARDMGSLQSLQEQQSKSEGNAPPGTRGETPAQVHGTGRFEVGFDMEQLVGEYRALRATVMRQWVPSLCADGPHATQEIIRFNEAIDQAIMESIARFVVDYQDAIRARLEAEARWRGAEASDRLKSTFMATMSHELRTPLNSIIGFNDVVLKGMAGDVNPEQTRQLGMAKASALHLLALVNDVLDLSKLEAGQLEVQGETFDIRASVERVIASMRAAASAKRLSLRVDVAPELGEVASDRRRVEQILSNLLSNAVKFTDQGSVTVSVDTMAEFTSSTRTLGLPGIRFRVNDSGIGIKAEDMENLFKPFCQLDNGRARQDDGTGLGLVISQRLAALLGGEVTVESQWMKGSTFTFTMPFVAGDQLVRSALTP
jgi:signal transduction histidine kinase